MEWTPSLLVAIAGISIVCLVIYAWIRGRYSRAPRVTTDESEQVASEPTAQSHDGVDTPSPGSPDLPQITTEPHELAGRIQEEEQRQKLSQASEYPPAGMEQIQVETPQKDKGRVERKRPKPIVRGGRPRSRTIRSGQQKSKQQFMRVSKPEIVCWKRQAEWLLGIEVPDEFGPGSELKVSQNETDLRHDLNREGCWLLEDVSGKVTVVGQEGVSCEIVLGEASCLVFKLSGPDLGQGRFVKSISAGWYLVVVPENWERHEDSGTAPVEPEYAAIEGYRAHFFLLERGLSENVVFITADSTLHRINTEWPRFELSGNQYDDGSEDIGPLFLQEPPKIRVSNKRLWEEIRTVIVGEEGPGRRKWRMAFTPNPEAQEQAPPSEIVGRESGWFFFRFYDHNDDLVESLDFRFARGLETIAISNPPSPLPVPEGHKSIPVEFQYALDYKVLPSCKAAKSLQIARQEGKTTVEIPPDPNLDRTEWEIGPRDGTKTKVTVLVERLWWALSSEDKQPERWQDKSLTLCKDDLAAASQKAIWLRVPRRRWVEALRVGFEYSKSRRYKLKVNETEIAIPLREFGDFGELHTTNRELQLMAWVERDDRRAECVLAVLPPRPSAVSLHAEAGAASTHPAWLGLGRKKSAFASAEMRPGNGEITVNGRSLQEYFSHSPVRAMRFLHRLLELEQVREVLSRMDVVVTVTGSSSTTTRQAKAVAHALARVLIRYDQSMKPNLKANGFGGANVKRMPTHG